MAKRQTDRVQTYIPGFDKLIQGGILRNSVNLISGGPGTGKSIFCMQFLYNGIKYAKEKGLYISFEESIEDLKTDAQTFGWNFDKLEKENKVKFIYLYPYEITNFQSKLISEITRLNAERIVIDSTSAFGMALEGDYEVRKELYALSAQLKKLNCTTFITSEIVGEVSIDHPSAGGMSRFGVEEFIADSVMTMHYTGGADDRAIRIVKMRRTNHQKGPLLLKITPQGIKIIAKGSL